MNDERMQVLAGQVRWTAEQISRELGVRYVLEGSVRKAANRVRITGQLIDAAAAAVEDALDVGIEGGFVADALVGVDVYRLGRDGRNLRRLRFRNRRRICGSQPRSWRARGRGARRSPSCRGRPR